MKKTTAYRSALVLAIATPLFMFWLISAVSILNGPGDRMYLGVVAVLMIGSLIARFRPQGMAYALIATAAVPVVIALIALVTGMQNPDHLPIAEILGVNTIFAVLFLASSRLFRLAA